MPNRQTICHRQLQAEAGLLVDSTRDGRSMIEGLSKGCSPAIWEVAPDDEGDLLFPQLLHCNVQRV